ncbi:disease resistance protein ADR2 isoform X2 [Capsella rubella]|uniref:disease resistance protein ADR2 isoform X2 n=1 Tax=Capsella rubella TaxID=81985 RepID=UPI000CD50F98|nr:disease resistance protein ADR2 isoform X2 [Capsella rubella]
MASSSYHTQLHVFTSFHGPDVRKTFLSHLRKQFNSNGITMFDDNQGIERGQTIDESLIRAIRNSRIAIVLLSKNYASSSWCLDELLEILKCKEELDQVVMTVFHGVEPSDVRKQGGEFGKAFDKTCDGRPEDHRQKWSQALTYVSKIAGQDFQKWGNEVDMIDEIASEVSSILNHPPSSDFNGMVGLKTHLREIESLLDLDNDKAKFVGISGPAGIGKTTIARALYPRLSSKFDRYYFVDNLREFRSSGVDKYICDEYRLKLHFHEDFFSKVLKETDMKIGHLGFLRERFRYQKVLMILDDVESLVPLEALAWDIPWFGPGSRVIVVTENQEILDQRRITDIYKVGFPSDQEALKIFCLYAFGKTSPPDDGFKNLATEAAMICCNLPLGLHVLGSSLRGKSQTDWKDELPTLKSGLDSRIEGLLKEGYESLDKYEQRVFLVIAVFFNHEHIDHVISMLGYYGNVKNVEDGLETLASKYLIQIDHDNGQRVVMQGFLRVMAREIISRQELLNRCILVDTHEICDVLEKAEGDARPTVLGS